MTDKLIAIGKIVAPHGVRGDVRVAMLTDFPDRFRLLKVTYLEDGTKLIVEGVKYHKQFVLLKFQGYNNMNDVEGLRGKIINVERKDATPLPAGHYFIFDIIGLTVFDTSGNNLGAITDVVKTGSNDVYVAEKDDCRPIMIPALKEVVKNIDLDNKTMTVQLQEEWD